MNLKIGGNNVGKIMYGDKQVGKMYFGGKLVYQNALPVGTVLWTGELNSASTNKIINLSGVNNNASNINSKICIEYGTVKYDLSVTATIEELREGVLLNSAQGYQKMRATLINNTIEIYFINDGYSVTSVKLV